ncbi:MAG: peroxiredoxin family protein [Candidatus Poseidoniales archaeon]
MRKQIVALLLLALVSTVSLASAIEIQKDVKYEPGFVEWELAQEEHLFVEGLNVGEAVLQRARPDAAVGSFTTDITTNGPVTVFNLDSEPIQSPLNSNITMQVYFSVTIDASSANTCKSNLNPLGDSSTTLFYVVSVGGNVIYESTVNAVVDVTTDNAAMPFEGEVKNLILNMSKGDVFTLDLQIEHNCIGTRANVHWGGFEQNSGGIVMMGTLSEPTASVYVDQQHRAHIEFEPTLAWGEFDVSEVGWEIWGPLASDEKYVNDADLLVETSSTNVMMKRDLGDNRTVWVWAASEKVPNGDSNVQICVNQIGGDPNEDCHAYGIIRFEVLQPDEGFANAAIWLSLTTFLSFIGYFAFLFRSGIVLPPPILGAMFVLTLLFIPTAFDQIDLGAENIQQDSRIVDRTLQNTAGEEYSISQLMEGKDAVIVGVILPGSVNAQDQAAEFNYTLGKMPERISIVQIVAGPDATMRDVTFYENQLNASWPILYDEDNLLTSSFPSGVADAVFVIDPSMHIAYSTASSAGSKEYTDAIDTIDNGGSHGIATYLSLIFGPGLFLLLLALPRSNWEPPEQAIAPGLLWLSTIVSGAAAILTINIIPLIVTVLPISSNINFYLNILMFIWMFEMSFFAAKNGSPYEVKIIAKQIHRLMPDSFSNWRELEDMERDVLIGAWLGWFGWLSFPSLIQQGVGASLLSGGFGIAYGIGFLLGIVLVGGLTGLCLRWIAAIGGPFSRLFGKFGSEVFAEFIGWCVVPVSLWALVNSIIAANRFGLL